ncbi:MAG: hypothetical protein D6715_09910 [Calditrichaeota bacterium]|nr:MAG: hypothetical protein D6715_09910 [Calditrichota bacterium]
MVRQEQFDALLGFRSEVYPVVSFYLHTDLSVLSVDEMRIAAKDLIKKRREELEGLDLTHSQRESLKADFEHILQYIEGEGFPGSHKGLALFSCQGENFFQAFPLPQRVKNALIIDPDPYIRPLIAIKNQYYRFCTVLVDQKRAQIFHTYMGETEELTHLVEEAVKRRVRYAGWYGLEEKRVYRSIERSVQEHYKRIARLLFQLQNRYSFDYFILGGQRQNLSEFERFLHRYLEERIIHRFEAEPFAFPKNEIQQRIQAIEQDFLDRRREKMVELLVTEAQKKQKAVLGLKPVLEAANMGAIRILLIEEGRQIPGRECLQCGFLTLDQEICPVCGNTTHPMNDLYDEIVESTINFDGEYYQIQPGTPLAGYEGIGAFLRFKPESNS